MTARRLLIDTDALVNLIALGCLQEAIEGLGFEIDQCARLPAAPYQIRGRRYFDRIRNLDREAALSLIRRVPAIETSRDDALEEELNRLPGFDVGEILLTVACLQTKDALLLTGDARCLRALGAATNSLITKAKVDLRRRIVFFPQVLSLLARSLGLEELDHRYRSSGMDHKTLAIIFGTNAPVQPTDFHDAVDSSLRGVRSALGPDFLYRI